MDVGARPPRLTTGALLVMVLVLTSLVACQASPAPSGGSPRASSSDTASPEAVSSPTEDTPDLTTPPDTDEAVLALAGALEEAGADVNLTGEFSSDPIGGQGVAICVNGGQVNTYAFDSAEEADTVAARIDPEDPSNVGTAIVEWAGNPRFWKVERLLVLYLGDDAAVEAGLTSVLGSPFARGEGRAPGRDLTSC